MSAEANKAIDRRFFQEGLNKGDLDAVYETFGINSYQSVQRSIEVLREAFPDIHFTIDDQIAEGDRVVTRYTATGTHQGAFMGINATGKRVTWTGIYIRRVVDGKLEEGWHSRDRLDILSQLGATVTPPEAGQ